METRGTGSMKPTAAANESEAQGAQPNVDKGEEESCRSCLYTGVATCAGLSAFFLHLAFEDHQPPSQQRPADTIRREITTRAAKIAGSTHAQKQSTDVFVNAIKLMQQKAPPKSNRHFHLAFSAMWAIAGMYRLYLN